MTQTAVAYFRTSSASNVGADKDSLPRQQAAVRSYAASQGITIVSEHYDAAVRGGDSIDSRPGFTTMLAKMGDVDMILVENASRFARDLIVQETGFAMLKAQGIKLVAVDDPDAFTGDTPTQIMIRQILGAVSQFEKASLVGKLKVARDRKRLATGRCEGRKAAPEAHQSLAKKLHGEGQSLRAICRELASVGFMNGSGSVYLPSSIQCMIG